MCTCQNTALLINDAVLPQAHMQCLLTAVMAQGKGSITQQEKRWMQSTGRGFKSYSEQKLHNIIRQVGHTYVPLSPSSITWYRPMDGDGLRLGR